MENDSSHKQDIGRLCKSLGIDPSHYVSFDKLRKHAGASGVEGQDSWPNKIVSGEVMPRGVSAARSRAWSVPEPVQLRFSHLARDPLSPSISKTSHAAAGSRTSSTEFAFISIAGGTGKTTIAGLCANVLTEWGHAAVLADCSPYNTMHDFFGLDRERWSEVSFASGKRQTSPVPVISYFHQGDPIHQSGLWLEFLSKRADFVLFDGMHDGVSAGCEWGRRGVHVLCPVVPDMVQALTAVTLDRAMKGRGAGRPWFLLNRFDSNNATHRSVRVWLHEQIGDQLLPFELSEDPALRLLASGDVSLIDLPAVSVTRRQVALFTDWLESLPVNEITENAGVSR